MDQTVSCNLLESFLIFWDTLQVEIVKEKRFVGLDLIFCLKKQGEQS